MSIIKKVCGPNVVRRSRAELEAVQHQIMQHLAQYDQRSLTSQAAVEEALIEILAEMTVVLSRGERRHITQAVLSELLDASQPAPNSDSADRSGHS